MAIDRPPAAPRRRLVLLLAGAAGCLDAVGYLMLGLFTANMTGNTILLGLSIGRAAWPDAVRNVVAIAAFMVGAGAGMVAVRGLRRLSHGLALEAAALAAALAVWMFFGAPRGHLAQPAASWLIALLAAAMGMQSATVRRVGDQRVATTYVTGTLTTLATDTAAELLDRWTARRAVRPAPGGTVGGTAGASPERTRATTTPLMAGIWGVYLLGALVGGFGEQRWSMGAVVAPLLVITGIIAADWVSGRAAREVSAR